MSKFLDFAFKGQPIQRQQAVIFTVDRQPDGTLTTSGETLINSDLLNGKKALIIKDLNLSLTEEQETELTKQAFTKAIKNTQQ